MTITETHLVMYCQKLLKQVQPNLPLGITPITGALLGLPVCSGENGLGGRFWGPGTNPPGPLEGGGGGGPWAWPLATNWLIRLANSCCDNIPCGAIPVGEPLIPPVIKNTKQGY